MKKYLIAGGILVGSYFLIKKFLPKVTSPITGKLELDEVKTANNVFDELFEKAEEKRKARAEERKKEKRDFCEGLTYSQCRRKKQRDRD